MLNYYCKQKNVKGIGMKKILLIVLLLFITGCSSNEKTTDYLDVTLYETQNISKNYESIDASQNIVFDTEVLSNKEYTLSFWMRPESNYLNTTIFLIDTKDGYLMMSTSENSDGFRTGINLSTENDKILSTFKESHLYMNDWNNIVIVKENNKYDIYLNGELLTSDSLKVNYLNSSSVLFGVNSNYDDPCFDGQFTQIKISNYVYSKQDILDEYFKILPELYLSNYDIEGLQKREDNMNFPENPVRGMYITWEISDEKYVDYYGDILYPSLDEGTKDIIINAVIEIDGNYTSREFQLSLSPKDSFDKQKDIDGLIKIIGEILNDGYVLPQKTSAGYQVEWSSDNNVIDNGIIRKNSDIEKEEAILNAKIIYDDETIELKFNVVLLDEYVGYVLAYFDGIEGEEHAKLIYSYDGLNWNEFNETPVLTSDLGTKRVRDPYLFRDTNGNFKLIATQGYDNPEIYYWDSEDLLSFNNHKMIKVADYNIDIGLSGERAWAPKVIYDSLGEEYYLMFSDPKLDSKGIYYVKTKDFGSFSYPNLYVDLDYEIIDASMIQYKDGYLMFYKDEREGANTIFYGFANSLSNGIDIIKDTHYLSLTKWLEGPFSFKINGKDEYLLYADNYKKARFIAWSYSDIKNDLIELDANQYSLPESVRHGSVVSVTQKELDRMFEVYGE